MCCDVIFGSLEVCEVGDFILGIYQVDDEVSFSCWFWFCIALGDVYLFWLNLIYTFILVISSELLLYTRFAFWCIESFLPSMYVRPHRMHE